MTSRPGGAGRAAFTPDRLALHCYKQPLPLFGRTIEKTSTMNAATRGHLKRSTASASYLRFSRQHRVTGKL